MVGFVIAYHSVLTFDVPFTVPLTVPYSRIPNCHTVPTESGMEQCCIAKTASSDPFRSAKRAVGTVGDMAEPFVVVISQSYLMLRCMYKTLSGSRTNKRISTLDTRDDGAGETASF